MKNFDFETYYNLLSWAKDEQVHLLHCFDPDYAWGGCTIAWKREGDGKNSRMLRVSISYCSDKDQFCRRIGATNALTNFFNENSILVPLGSNDSALIVRNLRNMFYLYGPTPQTYAQCKI